MPKNFVGPPFCAMFKIFLVAKKFMDKKGGSIKIFTVEKLLSHSAKKFRRWNSVLFQKFQVSKNVMDKRHGEASRFSVESFLSQSAEYFVGQPFCAVFQKFLVAKKVMDKRGGGYQDFPSNVFYLTVPKNSVGGSFTVSLISVIEKCWIREDGDIKIIRRNFFVSECGN